MTNPSPKSSAAPRLCASKTATKAAGKGKAKGKRKAGFAPSRSFDKAQDKLCGRDKGAASEAVIDAGAVDPSTTRVAGGPPPHLAARSREDQSALTRTRKLRKQATSRTAYKAAPPAEDDPLLGFAPYIHPRPRLNSITPERQRAFVSQLAATGIVQQAARHIGKSMEALYKLRARPGAEGFAAAWDAAIERGVTRLEDCALERAIQGTATPIVGREGILGWWDKPDNGLLRFLLQHRLPERYGVQQLKPGHPVYDSIAAEAVAAYRKAEEQDEEEVYASITAKVEGLRRRWEREAGLPHAEDQGAVSTAESGKNGMRISSGSPSSSSNP